MVIFHSKDPAFVSESFWAQRRSFATIQKFLLLGEGKIPIASERQVSWEFKYLNAGSALTPHHGAPSHSQWAEENLSTIQDKEHNEPDP